MARTAKKSNPRRLEALRNRVEEPDYLEDAITTIAVMLSRQILQERDTTTSRLATGTVSRDERFDPGRPGA